MTLTNKTTGATVTISTEGRKARWTATDGALTTSVLVTKAECRVHVARLHAEGWR